MGCSSELQSSHGRQRPNVLFFFLSKHKKCARQNYKVHTDDKGQMSSFSSFPNLCTLKFEFDVDYFFNFSNINNVLVRITKFTRTTKAKCPLFLPFQTCVL